MSDNWGRFNRWLDGPADAMGYLTAGGLVLLGVLLALLVA